MIKEKLNESKIVVLIGYLLSTSVYTFMRLETGQQKYDNSPWIIGLCFSILSKYLSFGLSSHWILDILHQITMYFHPLSV